jgi:hypothetical protein
MKPKTERESMKHLRFLFANAVEQERYVGDEFDKFVKDIINYGMVVMEKIITGQVGESDLEDVDEVIILSRENMFSEN